MARRGSFSDFVRSFNQGYGLVNQVGKDWEMSKVAQEKPSETFTQDQGQELDAIANAKDAQGNAYYKLEATPDGKYKVIPNFQNADGGDYAPAAVAAKGVNFMGKSYDQPLTDSQQTGARQQAMAGVMEKYGDAEGAMRYRQSAKQGELQDMQISQAQRQAKRDDRTDSQTALLDKIEKETADWTASRLTNPDGTTRDMAPDDSLAAGQYKVAKLVGAGKITEANALAKDNMAMAGQKIQMETAERKQSLGQVAAALANGDVSQLAPFYEKYVPDGAHITNVTQDPKTGKITVERESLDGRKLAPTIKSTDEILAGLKSFEDPMALYNFSQSEFQRHIHEKADARADRALAVQEGSAATMNKLHGAQINEIEQKTADKKELSTIHTALNTAIAAGDKAAEDAARKKLMTYTISNRGAQHMSALEQNANLMLASGKAKTMAEAIDMARLKVQSSPKDDYIKWTTGAMPLGADQLNEAMTTVHGPDWKTKVRGDGGGAAGGPKKGDEQVIQSGQNKGKTAVFDGQGWVLKSP